MYLTHSSVVLLINFDNNQGKKYTREDFPLIFLGSPFLSPRRYLVSNRTTKRMSSKKSDKKKAPDMKGQHTLFSALENAKKNVGSYQLQMKADSDRDRDCTSHDLQVSLNRFVYIESPPLAINQT